MRGLLFAALSSALGINAAFAGEITLNYSYTTEFRSEFADAISDDETTSVVVILKEGTPSVPKTLRKYIGYVRKSGGEVVTRNTFTGFINLTDLLPWVEKLVKAIGSWVIDSIKLDSLDDYHAAIFVYKSQVKTEFQRVIFVRRSEAALWQQIKSSGKELPNS